MTEVARGEAEVGKETETGIGGTGAKTGRETEVESEGREEIGVIVGRGEEGKEIGV
jgi:hypothetical protein